MEGVKNLRTFNFIFIKIKLKKEKNARCNNFLNEETKYISDIWCALSLLIISPEVYRFNQATIFVTHICTLSWGLNRDIFTSTDTSSS